MSKNTLTWIGIALIVIISGIFGACIKGYFSPKCPQIRSDTVVSYKLDTIKFAVKEPIFKTFHIRDTVLKEVKIFDTVHLFRSDSIQIVKTFFEKRNYQRDIVNDSDLYVSLNDTVSQNQLFGGIGKYVIKRPFTQTNNNPVVPPSRRLFIGAGIGTDLLNKVGLSGRITLQNKKDALYGFEITFIPGQKLIYSIHHDIKIKL